MVGALKSLGLDVRHEGVGLDGAVGWPYSVGYSLPEYIYMYI